MSVAKMAGYTDFSSAGVMQATQKIYSKKTLVKFYSTTCFGEICNTDYEGEIKNKGDKIVIRTIPDTTVRDYVKDADLVYESLESTAIEMTVDRAKYIGTRIDRIDEKLTDINWMDKWADDGSKKMQISVDRTILATAYASVAAANTGATAGALSGGYALGTSGSALVPASLPSSAAGSTYSAATDPLNMIMDAEAVLTEQNVPEDNDRFFVAPTWFINRLQKGDLRRNDFNGPAGQDVLRNGKVGQIGQFNIYRNNNFTPVNGAYPILFGHKCAITFVAALTETETLKHPTKFGTIMRSLMVYDFKVLKSEALGVLWVKPS